MGVNRWHVLGQAQRRAIDRFAVSNGEETIHGYMRKNIESSQADAKLARIKGKNNVTADVTRNRSAFLVGSNARIEGSMFWSYF